MSVRKKQPQLTRQAILAAAGSAFGETGYHGTGLAEIVFRAGLTKGALFHHFPDKRQLALGWLEEELAPAIRELWVAPLGDVDGLEGLRQLCRARLGVAVPEDPSAALAAFAAEVSGRDEVLGQGVAAVFGVWRDGLAAWLERGRAGGRIHRSIKPAAEAALMVAMITGILVSARGRNDAEFRRFCLEPLEAYLETLRGESG